MFALTFFTGSDPGLLAYCNLGNVMQTLAAPEAIRGYARHRLRANMRHASVIVRKTHDGRLALKSGDRRRRERTRPMPMRIEPEGGNRAANCASIWGIRNENAL